MCSRTSKDSLKSPTLLPLGFQVNTKDYYKSYKPQDVLTMWTYFLGNAQVKLLWPTISNEMLHPRGPPSFFYCEMLHQKGPLTNFYSDIKGPSGIRAPWMTFIAIWYKLRALWMTYIAIYMV